MKLVDILARELKVWPDMPEGGRRLEQDINNAVIEGDGFGTVDLFMLSERADDQRGAHVDRAQWQAAVDALKDSEPAKAEWTGSGLPPVGTVCEYISDTSWGEVKVIGYDGAKVVFKPSGGTCYGVEIGSKSKFIPIRTPAQLAAEERLSCAYRMCAIAPNLTNVEAAKLYDAGLRFEVKP